MENLFSISDYPINLFLKNLLQDKTTKKNIIWATDVEGFKPTDQITVMSLQGQHSFELQPRVMKNLQAQAARTKSKAEVMTPSWICNKMNSHCDEEWFGYKDVFNKEDGHSWIVKEGKIEFPKDKSWKDYVNSTRLEITCGEGPFLMSRYDTTTGETIPVSRRIGILDRKLRVVNENTSELKSWAECAVKAFQSCYGYEWQGDNLLIARCNALLTFVEYYRDRWEEDPPKELLKKIVNIIVWNLWQMDGLTGCVPMKKAAPEHEQIVLDLFGEENEKDKEERAEPCRIYDWKANKSVLYNSLKEGRE